MLLILSMPPIRAAPKIPASGGEYPGPPPGPPPHVVAPPALPLRTTVFIGGAGGNLSNPGTRTGVMGMGGYAGL